MDGISVGVLTGVLLATAWHDIRSHRIPNVLIVTGVMAGILLHARLEGFSGVVAAVGGCAVGLVVLLPFYVMRMLGAGDVKLMAMVGAFLGPWDVLGALLATLLAGGVMALVVALRAGRMTRLLQNVKWMVLESMLKMSAGQAPTVDDLPESVGKLPYAVAIAAGTLGFLAWEHMG